jgi:cell division protein FtsB
LKSITIECSIGHEYHAVVEQIFSEDNLMAYAKRRTSHKKELYYLVCLVSVLMILLFSVLGPGGYRDLRRARLELQEQRTRVDRLTRENAEKIKEISKLRTDPNALERYAREKGYGRPDEIIQQLPEKQNHGKH